MKWERYKKLFIEKAKDADKSDSYINACLEYAHVLFENDVPIIYDCTHFSKLVGYELEYIYRMSYSQKDFYRTFEIPKKNGTYRKISEPLPDLKTIQSWILNEILLKVEISKYAKAYQCGVSVKDNAKFHKNQDVVLTIDLKNFFPSIKYFDVYNIFRKVGYKNQVAALLANLCCLKNCLPQGAPTSPYISNIVMNDIDEIFGLYVQQVKLRYSRYADDLTFSGNNVDMANLLFFISKTIASNGFEINHSKTRIARKNARQEVTGIVVNSKLQLPKRIRKKIRQDIYYIKKFGINSHLERNNETRKKYIQHLLGLTTYASFINPNDNELKEYIAFLRSQLINNF